MPDTIKILVVDDQESQLVAHRALLSELGEVVTATSGREALRWLLRDEFAVVLLDVNMPDMDGLETAALIRRRKNCEDTPIIFVTAYADELQAARGYTLGAVDYILAPVIPEVLQSKVRTFVDLYRKTATVRRQAERLRRRTAQLGSLTTQLIQTEERERARLAQILHDHVQQLLAAASVRVRLARNEAADSESCRMLKEVDELISKSIAAARSLSVELHPPVLDSGLVPALEWLARHTEKTFRLKVAVDADPSLDVDPARRILLFDAVRELLLNTVKHAGADRAGISVSEPSPGRLAIVVEDTGRGFDPGRIDSEDAAIEHSGLRNIREKLAALDGDLSVSSVSGEGARITLELPVSNRLADVSAARETAPGEPIRVLLADDHEILRKGLRSLLERHGDIEVVGEAVDGVEAVELARHLRPHVVVMDLSMPRLDGIEATRAIVGDAPSIRVIGLSMEDGKEAKDAMQRAGAFTHLAKDGRPESLVSAIQRSVRTDGVGDSRQSALTRQDSASGQRSPESAGPQTPTRRPRERSSKNTRIP